ncbi:MAG: BMP family ABC transporter substrate-binding protein [Chloroflexi bacterium]|nr:MAG: BMP family ABC transporter substrate-binding protein [Chloroflexota bacterium]
MGKRIWTLLALLTVVALLMTACGGGATPTATPAPTKEAAPTKPPTKPPEAFPFGVVLVGPYNDHGWSEAHYTAGQYVEEQIPGAKMIWIDKVNPADRPETTLEQVVDDMVAQGAKIIFTTSDDFKDETRLVAQKYPDVVFIHISGDHVWTGEAPPNEGNLMGRMEYMKGVAGCAAALMTETKTIGYLGPLINDETRRLAASAYLGARYCYEHYRGGDPNDLRFIVTWIGFWFNIPGVTLDPTEVSNDLFNSGVDVLLSGIDTTEALVVAKQRAEKGERVFAIPYDFEGACEEAPEICLGVPYFNWRPGYMKNVKAVMEGTWKQSFDWLGPDWNDINNKETSAVGFVFGPALPDDVKAKLEEFIAGMGSGEIVLFKGPLNFQDGTPYLAEGEVATDKQIWYFPQLLEGMEGPSE